MFKPQNTKKIGLWGKSLGIRLDSQFEELGAKAGDIVSTVVDGDKIVIKLEEKKDENKRNKKNTG